MYPPGYFDLETLLTAQWSPGTGTMITSSVLPPQWNHALGRLGRDLAVRHYNGDIAHIRFEAVHRPNRDDDEDDYIWLSSEVTPVGDVPQGMMHDGEGVLADADAESIVCACASFVQDQIARAGIVWPRGREGGFLYASVADGVAVWGPEAEHAPVGALTA